MIIERGRNIPADSNKKAPGSAGIRDRDRPVVIGLLSHFDLVSSAAPYRRRVVQSTQATIQAESGRLPLNLVFKRLHLIFETQFQFF
jgi:hypothetical protein